MTGNVFRSQDYLAFIVRSKVGLQRTNFSFLRTILLSLEIGGKNRKGLFVTIIKKQTNITKVNSQTPVRLKLMFNQLKNEKS